MDNQSIFATKPGVKANPNNLPAHIAIVMDGNGRWAKNRKLSRTKGHQQGVKTAQNIVMACQKKGIAYLTLFAFGKENWKRPTQEVRNLFRILFLLLKKEISKLNDNNIRLKVIGDNTGFPPTLILAIEEAQQLTKNNSGMTLNLAVNYSGRWDILNGVHKIAKKVQSGLMIPEITESLLSQQLTLAQCPEPDFYIRTGGVQRISNFILWEFAYTEFYFTDILWPDFDENELCQALESFSNRERRFGLISEQLG